MGLLATVPQWVVFVAAFLAGICFGFMAGALFAVRVRENTLEER